MRALVTGGAGFIGSHLVDALRGRGDEVRVLDDLSTGKAERVPRDVLLIEGQVQQPEVARAAAEGCDVVFHLAAHRSVFRSVESPLSTDMANTHGTLTMLVAARDAGVRRFVNSSSSSVYGQSDQLPTREDALPVPKSPYAVSKLAAEHHCRVFAELFGLETVSLRYFNVYGPRQDPNGRYAAVIPRFIADLFKGDRPEIHGDGHQSRDFTFVVDAIAGNLRAAEAPSGAAQGQIYNIAGGEPWDVLSVLGFLAELCGQVPDPVFAPPRAGDVRATWADVSAAASILGHHPSVTMKEGLTETWSWFKSHPEDLGD